MFAHNRQGKSDANRACVSPGGSMDWILLMPMAYAEGVSSVAAPGVKSVVYDCLVYYCRLHLSHSARLSFISCFQ